MRDILFVAFLPITLVLACVVAFLAYTHHYTSKSVRRQIGSLVEQHNLIDHMQSTPAKYTVSCVVVVAVYQILLTVRLGNDDNANDVQVVRAQRDCIIVSAAALCFFLADCQLRTVQEMASLENARAALLRRTEGSAAALASKERECDELRARAAASAEAEAAISELERHKAAIEALRERTTRLMAERDASEASVEALKRQSKGLSDEYSRMLLVNERLENQLADYELVFGDEVKKKK
jgi:hypothetical protein